MKVRTGSAPVAAMMYIWTQHFQNAGGKKLEDNLDEAFNVTKNAGFSAIEGWLSWFATPEAGKATAAALARHKLSMFAAYTGGRLHDGTAPSVIDRIVSEARLARLNGVTIIVLNPDVKSDGSEKSESELDQQAKNLDTLGARLRESGLSLAIHSHDKEMRSAAREWHHILANTKPAFVGFCMDVHWIYRGGQDPLALLEAVGPRILDLHLRNSQAGVWSQDLDDGDVDYKKIAALLKRQGFKGQLTVELAHEKATPSTRPLGENLARSRIYVRRIFGR